MTERMTDKSRADQAPLERLKASSENPISGPADAAEAMAAGPAPTLPADSPEADSAVDPVAGETFGSAVVGSMVGSMVGYGDRWSVDPGVSDHDSALSPELEEAWLAALDGETIDVDEASALATLMDGAAGDRLLADAELDGLLAARGNGGSGAGSEFWVESVLRRAEEDGLVRSSGRRPGPQKTPATSKESGGVSGAGRAIAGMVLAFLAGVGAASAVFLGLGAGLGFVAVDTDRGPRTAKLVELHPGRTISDADVTFWTDAQGRRFLVARRAVGGAGRPDQHRFELAKDSSRHKTENLLLAESHPARGAPLRAGVGVPGDAGPESILAVESNDVDVAGSVATLLPLGACRWEDEQPPGLRVGTRRLGLVRGAARVRFDSGALVELEAPARMDILSSNRAVLWRGRAMAKVPRDLDFALVTPGAPLHPPGSNFVVQVADDGGTAAATWGRNGGYEGFVSIDGQARHFARPVEFATAARRVVTDLEGRGRAFVDVKYFSLREVPLLKLDVRLANRRWTLEGRRDRLVLPEDLRRSMTLTPARKAQRFHAIIRVEGHELSTRSPRDLERLQAAIRALPSEDGLRTRILRHSSRRTDDPSEGGLRKDIEVEVEVRPGAEDETRPSGRDGSREDRHDDGREVDESDEDERPRRSPGGRAGEF